MKKQKYTKFEIGQEVALKSSHQTFKNATLIIHTEGDVKHTFATLSLQRGMPVTVLQKILGHSRIEDTMIYAKVVDSFQHDQLLKAWNEDKTEHKNEIKINLSISKITQETKDQFEKTKTEIKNAVQSKKTELEVFEELDLSALEQFQKMGFIIKKTSPIQKLEGIFHIISW